MSKKLRNITELLIICLMCGILFVSGGYLYLKSSMKKTENYTSSVPYAKSTPDNAGVLLNVCGDKLMLYFDFFNRSLYVAFIDDKTETNQYYGYNVDYNVDTDYNVIAGIIDRLGGIELVKDNETLRYTGVQVVEELTTNTDALEYRRNVIKAIISKISQSGFEKDYFVYIIKNSKTDLTVPDCYYWSEYMKDLCKYGSVIN